jgi:N-acyl-L-homoserine lactone synthetase
MSGHNGKTAALAMIDEVAARGLSLAAPIRFGVAESPEEREATYHLRYEVSIERGYARPEELPGGLERDTYDDHAVHVMGWDGDKLVTTARLVFPEPGIRLPTEAAFDLDIEPHSQVADMGRVIVAHESSETQHRILAGLMAFCWTQVRAHGFVYVCAAFATLASIRLYRYMGFQITPLAQPRHYWGEERYPVRFDVLDSAQMLMRRWLAGDEPVSDEWAQAA